MIHVFFIVSGACCLCYNDRLRSHRTPLSLVRNAFSMNLHKTRLLRYMSRPSPWLTMQQSATIMHLFHEYSSSQPHMMCLQHTLKLPERSEAYLLYKVCSWLQRRQQGKDLHILTRPENAGTEEHDKKHCQKRS